MIKACLEIFRATRRHRCFYAIALTLSTAACLRVDRPYSPPRAEDVALSLLRLPQRIRTLRAEARMRYQSKETKVGTIVRMMGATGGRLRIDVLSPFDSPLAQLVTQSGQFTMIDSKSDRHYYGPALACNLARLLRISLDPVAVFTILRGGTPLIAYERASLRWDARAQQEVLTLSGRELEQTLRLRGRPGRWRLYSSEIKSAQGKELLRISMSDYRGQGGILLPRRLSIAQPIRSRSIELRFKLREINIELPKIAFDLLPAGGLPSHLLRCEQRSRLMQRASGSHPPTAAAAAVTNYPCYDEASFRPFDIDLSSRS